MYRANHKIGIDANRPILADGADSGSLAPQVADPSILADTGAGWVRLNFVLGPWSGPRDRTRYQGQDWEGAYRTIISGLRGRGLNIYGLISNEAVRPADMEDRFRFAPPPGDVGDEWIDRYVANFAAMVRMFHRDVEIFESFNEPDDWHGADRNWIHPGWFAIMLERIYRTVKGDPDLGHVKLVSGPLQGLEQGNGAAGYLRRTYEEGVARFGWGKGSKPFPFDGVGYHLYVKEGRTDNWGQQEQAVRQTYRRYLDEMKAVIRAAEGEEKPLYVSELGWFSNRGTEDFQARNLPLALGLMLDEPSVALAFWFCTQDFGGENDNKYYGLYRKGALTPANRKPAYASFQKFCRRAAPEAEKRMNNQTMIDAIALAAGVLRQGLFDLIRRADLWELFFAPQDPYTGPPVEQLPNLTGAEKDTINAQLTKMRLAELMAGGPVQIGATTTYLNLRTGPGTEHSVVTTLPPGASVMVISQQGPWLRVSVLGRTGYVHRDFVLLARQTLPAGFLRTRPDLAGVPMAPPARQKITPDSGTLAQIWNRYGGLLSVLAYELKIDVAVAVAVLAVESAGRAFGPDGRMVIRFENHIFYNQWGRNNPDRFAQHFQFNRQELWKEHRWRPDPGQPWRDLHLGPPLEQSQKAEWDVFEFARRSLDETAAMNSISMGAPQIMGFNSSSIGYESVQQMFAAFSDPVNGERNQILGLFDYVKATPRCVEALQRQDFYTFAVAYNGAGQAALYGDLLRGRLEAFRQLRAGEPALAFEAMPALPEMLPPGVPTPGGVAFLPPVTAGQTLADQDPRLHEYWREHINQGFKRNDVMFRRVLTAFMTPYYTTIWMYRILFAVGIVSFLVAAGLSAWTRQASFGLIFGGLSAAAFISYFLSRPLRSLEENLEFITWLGVVYNTYWSRLVYAQDPRTVQEDLRSATRDATAEIERIIDKHGKRGRQ